MDQHPANCVRIILGQDQDGDDDTNNRYTRAARTMRNWLREGVLFAEGEPAIYVYHQVFTEGGQEFTRRGFMCRTRLERFGEGNIYPHEETHGGAKADRLKLWKACKANCSQIFGLYPDEANVAQEILEEGHPWRGPTGGDRPPGRAASHLACDRHRHDHGCDRRHGRAADLHRRWPPSIRDGLQLPRRVGRRTGCQGGATGPRAPSQLCADDVRIDERSRHDRAADASALSWSAGDDLQ